MVRAAAILALLSGRPASAASPDAGAVSLPDPQPRDADVTPQLPADVGARSPGADLDGVPGTQGAGNPSANDRQETPPAAVGDSRRDEEQIDLVIVPGVDIATLDLEQLLQGTVVSATKSEVMEDVAPAITTVVSRESIQQWGYASVEEVLRHVAGLYVIDDHIIPNVSVRGVSGGLRSESGLIKVMIDGQSISFRATSGNWLGPELIPLSAVQRIEVIRGPASALYGADAFLGVINIVTRRPDQMNGGDFVVGGNYQGHLGWGQDASGGVSMGPVQVLASFRTTSEDRSGLRLPTISPAPRLPSYAPADGRARGLTRNSDVALAKLSYRFGDRATATVTGYYSAIDRGAEFADWAQLTHNLDSDGRMNGTDISLRHGMAALEVSTALASSLDLRLTGQFFSGGPTSRDRIEVGSNMYYVKRDFGFYGFGAEAETSWRPRESLSVLTGVGLILDHERLPAVFQVMKSDLAGVSAGSSRVLEPGGGTMNLSNTGVHVQVLWLALDWLSLTAGARYDHHNIYGGKPSARLGGVVELTPQLRFKLLYGSAFKAPSPQLMYGSPLMPGDITGNRGLKPSYLHTVEGQLVYRPRTFLVLTSGLAYSYLLDKAEFAQLGVNLVARNISQVEALSWESELRFNYRRKLDAYANLSVNRTAKKIEEQGYLAAIGAYTNAAFPRVVANAGVSALVLALPIRLSMDASWVSARASSTTNALDANGRYELRPYFLLGGTLRTVGLRPVANRETVLMIAVRNALNVRIADPGFAGVDYPQLGRSAMVQLAQEW